MCNENNAPYKYKEVLVEIGLDDFDNMYPVLTREVSEEKINYYLFNRFKFFCRRNEKRQLIKSFKVIFIPILNIYFDGLYDNYLLFDCIPICKKEKDRYFFKDWE